MSNEKWEKGTDPVTGLPEMHVFLQDAYKRAQKDLSDGTYPSCASVCFNVANFKQYNNLYGFQAGDECLKGIAGILAEVFEDDEICRQSADTFLVMVRQDVVVSRVEEACRRVNAFLANPGIQMKAGIRMVDKNVDVMKEQGGLFDQAMTACDSIKHDRNHSWAFYTQEMGKYFADRNYILEHFESALENGDLRVCFQPIVRSLTGKFCNSEALSRWEARDYGSIRPDTFIKVLEEVKLIHRLDLFVLNKVAEILRHEIDHGIPYVPVSINFSRLDFILMNPFEEVENVVKKYNLSSDLICIEITETALLEDKTVLSDAIDHFRNAGYQVWLDDFGSGYSSLNVLQDFMPDEIKLDMAFLRNYSEKSRKLITAIIIMAKTMGLHTLAEGVETKEQADFLTAIGCEKMQGYYYARPMYMDMAVNYPEQSKINVETPEEEKLLNRACAVNVVTDAPLGLLLFDGSFRMLYVNEACRLGFAEYGFDTLEKINQAVNDAEQPWHAGFLRLAYAAKEEGSRSLVHEETGRYVHVTFTKLSEAGSLTLFQIELQNLDR